MQRAGATWLTREDRDHEIADAVQWLDLVHRDVMDDSSRKIPPTTSIIGFSQGVATGIRWLMLGQVRPTQLVIWAGSLATDMDQEQFGRALTSVRTTLVCGTRDEFIPPKNLDALSSQLTKAGVRHEVRTFDGTHTLDSALLETLLVDIAGAHTS
jgi:predicted esterase